MITGLHVVPRLVELPRVRVEYRIPDEEIALAVILSAARFADEVDDDRDPSRRRPRTLTSAPLLPATMSGLGTAIEVQSQPSSIMFVPSIKSAVPPRYGAPEIDTPLPTEDPTEPDCVKSMPPCAELELPFGVNNSSRKRHQQFGGVSRDHGKTCEVLGRQVKGASARIHRHDVRVSFHGDCFSGLAHCQRDVHVALIRAPPGRWWIAGRP